MDPMQRFLDNVARVVSGIPVLRVDGLSQCHNSHNDDHSGYELAIPIDGAGASVTLEIEP